MRRVTIPIRLKKGEVFYLEPMCCIHIGNVGHREDKFKERFDAIMRDPHRATILMGDLEDAIYPSGNEKRYDPDTIDERYWPPQKGYAYLRKRFKPMAQAGKLLGVSQGNHDLVLRKRFGHDYITEFAEELEVRYLGVVWFVRFRFIDDATNKVLWDVIVNGAHGRFGGRRLGGNLNAIEDKSRGYDADIFLRGHTHQEGYSKKRVLTFYGEKTRYFAAVGSFLDGMIEDQEGYAEEADYEPLPVGTITFSMDPWRKKIDFHS